MAQIETNNTQLKNTAKIGSFCILTYLVSYLARNITGVVTPIMVAQGEYTKSYLGMLTTIYFAIYAAGQLLNGILGDRIRPRYMILTGCLMAGVGMGIFPLWNNPVLNIISFGMLGFGLSMLRGPLMKVIAENMSPTAAETVCVLFSVASFAGPLIASLFAVIFNWQWVFIATALFSVLMGVASFVYFTNLAKKGIIVFNPKKENIFKGIKNLFLIKNFVYFLLVGAIVEIGTSSINFWVPTYVTEYLGLSAEMGAGVFSFMSLLKIVSPFICIFLYHKVIKDVIKLEAFLFALSAVFFVFLLFTSKSPVLNIIFFSLAKLIIGCASTVLWSIFIPSLAKYGSVSAGNGVFDFTGYAAAALLNAFFASFSNWSGVIVSWIVIMLIGFAGAFGIMLFRKGKEEE